MLPAIIAGASALSGLLGGLFGDHGNGQNEQLRKMLEQMYSQMPDNNDQSINKYYNTASQNLYGQEQRDVRSAGNRGFAQSSAMNLSNPYTLMNRYVNNAYSQYAPQFGQLEEGRAKSIYGGQQDAIKNKLALLQMMQANAQGGKQGFNFSRDFAPGLLSLGGSLGGAVINRG